MRIASILLGAAFLGAAVAMAADDPLLSIGEMWRRLHPNSLVGFGALVEKRIDPDLWLDAVLPLLGWPAWLLPLVLGAVVLAALRPFHRHKRRAGWRR